MSSDSLTSGVSDPAILAGILDYFLADEALLIEFAEFAGVSPELPALARSALPGFSHL
jgi:hypothetical protein